MRVSTFRDDALGRDDAVALRERLRSREVSASDLVGAAIDRARSANEVLNAVVLERYEEALEAAKACDVHGPGLFTGVPTFIKDSANEPGYPNRFGSRATPDTPATAVSPIVELIELTGMIPLGRSTMPEFGLTGTTEPMLSGATLNPWSTNHSTGGSSGGAAALVAAGVVPVAHGNDGGGSLRIPASCCGLVGLKASRGRLPQDPLPKVIPIDFAVEGLLSRSVRDTAAFLHAADESHRSSEFDRVGHITHPGERRLRIGMLTTRIDGVALDSANLHALQHSAATLEELGHKVDIIDNPFPTSLNDDFFMFWSFPPFLMWHGGAQAFGDGWDRNQLEPWTKYLVGHFRRRAHKAPAAFRRLRKLAASSDLFADHDVLMSTTLCGPVHEIGYVSPEIDGELQIARASAQFSTTPVFNVTGSPSISLPLASDPTGLPMGIHFAADLGKEATLLELALELEQACPWETVESNGH